MALISVQVGFLKKQYLSANDPFKIIIKCRILSQIYTDRNRKTEMEYLCWCHHFFDNSFHVFDQKGAHFTKVRTS